MYSVMQRMDARDRLNAERALKVPQENYLIERKERLKRIQKSELLEDDTLLRSIKKARTQPPWFLSRDVDNNTGGILEQLSSFFSDDSNRSKNIRELIDQLTREDGFPKGRKYDMLDHPEYKRGLQPDDPGFLIAWLRELVVENRCSPPGAPSSNDEGRAILKKGFNIVHMALLLLRFVDERNPETKEYPNSDGSNLHEDDLKMAWLLHRAWVRTIHLRSLEIGSEKFGSDHLHQIMQLGIALHIAELQRVPMDKKSRHRIPLLYGNVLQTIHHEYFSGLVDFAKDLRTEKRTQQPTTIEDTLKYNMSQARFNAVLDEASSESTLLAYLMMKNNYLEHIMDQEHVEDVLMNKRIVINDENFATFDIVLQEDYTYGTIYKIPNQESRMLDYERRVRKISQSNRKRRNYLLLRDWSKKRPWKQIYKIINTLSDPGMRQCIRDFYSRIETLKEIERAEIPNPSSAANVWSSIFPVHPIASHDDEKENPFHPSYFDGGCVICYDSFEKNPDALIVVLHCNHIFHFSCIRDYWDHDAHYQSRCSTCRSGGILGGWYLHQAAGIYPEAIDLFDNRIIAYDAIANRISYETDADWREQRTENQHAIETDPDLGDLFRQQSDSQYNESANWAPSVENGGGRDPDIEMIHFRRRRREINRQRREAISYKKRDIRSVFGPPPDIEIPWIGQTAEQAQKQQENAARMARQEAIANAADIESAAQRGAGNGDGNVDGNDVDA